MSDGLAELLETPAQTRALTPFDRAPRIDATSMDEYAALATILVRGRAGGVPTTMFGNLVSPRGWAAPPLAQPFYRHWWDEDRREATINYPASDAAGVSDPNTRTAIVVNADPQVLTTRAMGQYCLGNIALDDSILHAADLCRDIGERVGRLAHTFVITGTAASSDLVNAAVTGALIAATAGITWFSHAVHDPLPQLEETRQHCLAVLARAEDSLRRDVVESVRRQLSTLLDAEEWDTQDREPAVTSFGHLVAFLARHNELRAPSLTLADRRFVASFLQGPENAVHLEFDETGWVRWIVSLSPVGRDPHFLSGTASVPLSQLKTHLDPFHIWHWMAR